MNDFTKEELIALSHSICRDWSEHPIYITLLEKLISLIENYCDHEAEGHYHVAVDKCCKCGVIVE